MLRGWHEKSGMAYHPHFFQMGLASLAAYQLQGFAVVNVSGLTANKLQDTGFLNVRSNSYQF